MIHFFVRNDAPVTRSSDLTVYMDSDRYCIFRITNLSPLNATFMMWEAGVLYALPGDVLAIHVSGGRIDCVSVRILVQDNADQFEGWLLENRNEFSNYAATLYVNARGVHY